MKEDMDDVLENAKQSIEELKGIVKSSVEEYDKKEEENFNVFLSEKEKINNPIIFENPITQQEQNEFQKRAMTDVLEHIEPNPTKVPEEVKLDTAKFDITKRTPYTENVEQAIHLASETFRPERERVSYSHWVKSVKALLEVTHKTKKPYKPSPEQLRSILTTSKAVLVDACPGAGKTASTTYKAFMDGIILGATRKKQVILTYTNQATMSTIENFSRTEQMYKTTLDVKIKTVHGFARDIEKEISELEVLTPDGTDVVIRGEKFFEMMTELEAEEGPSVWAMIDPKETYEGDKVIKVTPQSILIEAINKLGLNSTYSKYLFDLEGWLSVISEKLITSQEELMGLEIFGEINDVTFVELMKIDNAARTIREEHGLISFQDMLDSIYSRLKNAEKLEDLRNQRAIEKATIDYVYIDEFQDISPLQWGIILELFRLNPDAKLYCVGDSDQSIYSFRGADNKILVDFQESVKSIVGGDTDDIEIIYYTANRRSGKGIVDFTSKFIKKNKMRHDKKMMSFNEFDTSVRIVPSASYKESMEVAEKTILQDLIKEKNLSDSGRYDWSEFGIIFREHRQSYNLMLELEKNGFSINIGKGGKHPAEFSEVRDIIGIMEMLTMPNDVYLTKQHLYKILPGVNKDMAEHVSNKMIQAGKGSKFSNFVRSNTASMESLRDIYRELHINKNFEGALDRVLALYIETYLKWMKSRIPNAYVARDYLMLYKDMSYPDIILNHNAYLKNISNVKNNIYGVNFNTMHSSKGLEFPKVYVLPIGNTLTPKDTILAKMSLEYRDAYIEEERRLLYVAITRAERDVTVFVENVEHTFPRELLSIKRETVFNPTI